MVMIYSFYVVGNKNGFLKRDGSGITQDIEIARCVEDERYANHLANLYTDLQPNTTKEKLLALRATITIPE